MRLNSFGKKGINNNRLVKLINRIMQSKIRFTFDRRLLSRLFLFVKKKCIAVYFWHGEFIVICYAELSWSDFTSSYTETRYTTGTCLLTY